MKKNRAGQEGNLHPAHAIKNNSVPVDVKRTARADMRYLAQELSKLLEVEV